MGKKSFVEVLTSKVLCISCVNLEFNVLKLIYSLWIITNVTFHRNNVWRQRSGTFSTWNFTSNVLNTAYSCSYRTSQIIYEKVFLLFYRQYLKSIVKCLLSNPFSLYNPTHTLRWDISQIPEVASALRIWTVWNLEKENKPISRK